MESLFLFHRRGWTFDLRIGRPPCRTYWIDLWPAFAVGSYWFIGDVLLNEPKSRGK